MLKFFKIIFSKRDRYNKNLQRIYWDDMKSKVRPFDLILFKGGEFVSKAIQKLQALRLGKNASDFTHCGIIITTEVIKLPGMEDGRLYIWESTMSGNLGEGINNIDGESFLGCQIRDFEAVIEKYQTKKTTIAWCKLSHNPIDNPDNWDFLKGRIGEFITEKNYTRYDANFVSLIAALYPPLRPLRKLILRASFTRNWLFCSELAALTYKELEVVPASINEEDVLPVDFIGYDEDGLPDIVAEPIYIMQR